MDIKVKVVKQYNATYKHLILIDGEPDCITDSGARASECIQYVNGYDAEINDGAIKKALDKYRLPVVNKMTEKKLKRVG